MVSLAVIPMIGSILALVTLAVIGLVLGLYLQESRRPRALCLMYHRFRPKSDCDALKGTEKIFTVAIESFEEQIRTLCDEGYAFLSADELCAIASGSAAPADRSVLITIDDGCESVLLYAVPILKKYDARAILFVTTDPKSRVFRDLEGQDPRIADQELRQLDRKVLEIGAHSVTHRPLRDLSEEEMRHELKISRDDLSSLMAYDVNFFSVPGNWYDRRVMATAREIGYRGVWISNPGSVRAGTRLFGLPRVNIEGPYTIEQFKVAISPQGVMLRRMASFTKRLPSRLLGPRLWLPVRSLIMKCIPGGHISNRRVIAILGSLGLVWLALMLGLLVLQPSCLGVG